MLPRLRVGSILGLGLLLVTLGLLTAHADARAARPLDSTPADSLSSLRAFGPEVAWAEEQPNAARGTAGILRTADGGRRWTNMFTIAAGRRTITSVSFVSAAVAWLTEGSIVANGRQTLWRSTDAGRRWTPVGTAPANCTIDFINAVDGWCVDIDGAAGSETVTIDRSTDAGRHWVPVDRTPVPGQPGTPGALPFACDKLITFTSAQDAWAGQYCNGGPVALYASTDGGARWQRRLRVGPPTDGDGAGFGPVLQRGSTVLVALTANGPGGPTVVERSTDGGHRWQAVAAPAAPAVGGVELLSPEVWRVVASRTVASTDDAGQHWVITRTNVALGAAAEAVQFATAQVGWAVDPNAGTVLRTADGGAVWTPVSIPAPAS